MAPRSPLAASFARLADAHWKAKPSESALAKARQKIKPLAAKLRKAKWGSSTQRDELA
jgi:hypothetical protein